MYFLSFINILSLYFLCQKIRMSGKSSNPSSSKNTLQQRKLDYFGIINNFVQEKGKSTASLILMKMLLLCINLNVQNLFFN